MRLPGMRKERGTQVGARRKSPSLASKTSDTRAAAAVPFAFFLAICRIILELAQFSVRRVALIARRHGAGKHKLARRPDH